MYDQTRVVMKATPFIIYGDRSVTQFKYKTIQYIQFQHLLLHDSKF